MTETAKERRAARKAAQAEERAAQAELDEDKLDELEVLLGDSNVGALEVPYTPELPTLAIVRCPKPVEWKRYQSRIKVKNADTIAAAEELGAVCVVYPEDETLAKLVAARPALSVQFGTCAANLARGREVEEGKD